MKKTSVLVMVMTFVITAMMFAGSAFAQGPTNNNRPGWGHGDHNHHHTGPPGHSNHPGNGHHPKFHKFIVAWYNYLHNHFWKWHS